MEDLRVLPGRGLVTKLSTQMRLDALELIDIKTDKLSSSAIDLADIQNNIESFIGTTEIPLGIVGPLLFNDSKKQELVYCAAGTLEGALVASMNRGARALSLSGGVSAEIAWQRMTRAPMFLFETEKDAAVFKKFIEPLFEEIQKVTRNYSNHAKLEKIEAIQMDAAVHLKFVYTTGDASGQNMTTSCTWHAMLFIIDRLKTEKEIVPLDFVIEGNGAGDKKVSDYNIRSGRGINVTATCLLSEKVINEILRTTSDKLINCIVPSKKLALQEGMVGYNINVANAVAAIFVATGQDLASIHESGVGILNIEKTRDGLKLQLNLTNLVIGTVGGGTSLPKQSQALEIMKCLGSGKVERFAKLIAAFALGLEISTFAAIVSGEFAKAHEKLGRNKPVKWLLRSELTQQFIVSSLNGFFKEKQVAKVNLISEDLLENGILTTVTKRISKKLIGFVPFEISYLTNNKEQQSLNLLIKSKASDEEVIKGLHVIAASIDPQLSDLIKEHKNHLEYKNCHLKELEMYTYLHETGFENMPAFYGQHIDPKREIFLLIQELLDYASMRIINSENQPEAWKREDILATISAISKFHRQVESSKFNNVQNFEPWRSKVLYKKLISIILKENDEKNNLIQLKSLLMDIDNFEEEAKSINLKKTVIHNDFNPRNIAIRKNGEPAIYDWELAVVDFPQRDILEFLSFVLTPDFKKEDLFFYLNYHYELTKEGDWKEWIKAYKYSLKVYIASRVSFYEVSGILIKYDFSKRILDVAFRMLSCLNEDE